MERYQLYNKQDIDFLNEELKIYKRIVDSLTNSHTNNNDLQIKTELDRLKERMTIFEGEMNTMKDVQDGNLENDKKHIVELITQMEDVQEAVNQLKRDNAVILNQLKQINDKITEEEKQQLKEVKEGTSDLKTDFASGQSSQQQTPVLPPSSFKQLQNLLQTTNQPKKVVYPKNKQHAPSEQKGKKASSFPNRLASRPLPMSPPTSARPPKKPNESKVSEVNSSNALSHVTIDSDVKTHSALSERASEKQLQQAHYEENQRKIETNEKENAPKKENTFLSLFRRKE
ncbi:hypothetical protein [Lentibacillus saliphilus]|uniref:hypothetical protein n=1 Tax=Lentibacillus saliphilus TaxID=2737028 RepID=UPI001C2FA50B|nr:hypothetical protein [Lentibacillus saliphilus]